MAIKPSKIPVKNPGPNEKSGGKLKPLGGGKKGK